MSLISTINIVPTYAAFGNRFNVADESWTELDTQAPMGALSTGIAFVENVCPKGPFALF